MPGVLRGACRAPPGRAPGVKFSEILGWFSVIITAAIPSSGESSKIKLTAKIAFSARREPHLWCSRSTSGGGREPSGVAQVAKFHGIPNQLSEIVFIVVPGAPLWPHI